MNFTGMNFVVQSTGKRLSSIDNRNVVKYLTTKGRIQITAVFSKLIGLVEQISFTAPIVSEDGIFQAIFPSVKKLDKAGNPELNEAGEQMYVSSAKVNTLGQFTDTNTANNVREAVKSILTDEEKASFDKNHAVFELVSENDEPVTTEIEVNNGFEKVVVTAYVIQYKELEEKQRDSEKE